MPPTEPIQVMPERGESGDETAWREAGRRRFEAAYSADDSIYEQLIHDAPVR